MARVGIVLAGGFAKGAYQVGILNAIGNFFNNSDIHYMSASSIGVLNAYAFLSGNMGLAKNVWSTVEFKSFRSFTREYLRSSMIDDVISELVSSTTNLNCNLYAACFNCTRAELNYINLMKISQGDIGNYLRASVTMPLFARAVEIDGNKYVDGGLVDNIPVTPLVGHNLDYIIVVHFDNHNYKFENIDFDSRLIKINFPDEKFMKSSMTFDSASLNQMLQSGYSEGMTTLSDVFSRGTNDVEYILSRANEINRQRGTQKVRLTGDVVVSNINKLLKKFVTHKI